jgi:queuine tRNA-ribosyltransferase
MTARPLSIEIVARGSSSHARAGVIHTAHGDIDTPAFIPVATRASVKGLTSNDLSNLDIQLIIANTYHLMLRPGAEQVAALGGLHAFMHWDRAISTDSGGFQVFSLGAAIRDGVGKIASIFPDEPLRSSTKVATLLESPRKAHLNSPLAKIDEDGVTFSSHLDGSRVRLTPERSIEIQQLLGGDFMLAFDECTSPLDSYEYTRKALERTHRWAARCLEQHSSKSRPYQSLFGIVQGGAFQDLRVNSARHIGSLPFEGIAIGGSLGRSKTDMHSILDWTIPVLPEGKPRHLLGIGEPEDVIECVERGVDLFDCAAPTRWARNGALIISREAAESEGVSSGRLTISNARFSLDTRPPDPTCGCPTCRQHTRAYLHHLYRARELSYYRLATIHNLYFMMALMGEIRRAIKGGQWHEFAAARRRIAPSIAPSPHL